MSVKAKIIAALRGKADSGRITGSGPWLLRYMLFRSSGDDAPTLPRAERFESDSEAVGRIRGIYRAAYVKPISQSSAVIFETKARFRAGDLPIARITKV